jgi:hypothetical protein
MLLMTYGNSWMMSAQKSTILESLQIESFVNGWHGRGGRVFEGELSSSRVISDFTVRVTRSYENIQVLLEARLIFWKHGYGRAN